MEKLQGEVTKTSLRNRKIWGDVTKQLAENLFFVSLDKGLVAKREAIAGLGTFFYYYYISLNCNQLLGQNCLECLDILEAVLSLGYGNYVNCCWPNSERFKFIPSIDLWWKFPTNLNQTTSQRAHNVNTASHQPM